MRRSFTRLAQAVAPAVDHIRDAVCRELKVSREVVVFLEGAMKEDLTVPFVARYRRHLTGGLNETEVERAFDTILELRSVFAAREKMLADLVQRNLLSPELKKNIDQATTMAQLEAIYHPFKLVKKTNAAKAREAGLDKWATALMTTDAPMSRDFFKLEAADMTLVQAVVVEALSQVQASISATEDGLRTAAIVVEYASKGRKASVKDMTDDEFERKRKLYQNYNGKRYRNMSSNLEAHNILAIFRGESQGFLKVAFEAPHRLQFDVVRLMLQSYPCLQTRLGRRDNVSDFVQKCIDSAYKEHVVPHAERLLRSELKRKAETEAIKLFKRNLRRLLTQRPLQGHVLLAVDPGLGNGCKWVVLSAKGDVLVHGKFFLTGLMKEDIRTTTKLAAELRSLRDVILQHNVTRIAVGDGTASYETETALLRLVGEDPALRSRGIETCRCSEHGASVYSGSEAAKEELGHLDLLFRSAVSIGRRVLDPLSEYVKIPVKSLGVGMYQHDIPERLLEKSLNETTVGVVAQIGVDITTASRHVLAKVPGLNNELAEAIVTFRSLGYPIASRKSLKEVKGIKESTFTKCAGFIRVPNSNDKLDDTAVHPETYDATRRMLAKAGVSLSSDSWEQVAAKLCKAYGIPPLVTRRAERPAIALAASGDTVVPVVVPSFPSGDDLPLVELPLERAQEIGASVGVAPEQVTQILSALCAPRVDPRDDFNYAGLFTTNHRSVSSLRPGQQLLGRVENVTKFGAWVDIGVETTGFVHCSALVDEDGGTLQVSPLDVIAPCDVVTCEVIDVTQRPTSGGGGGGKHEKDVWAVRLRVVVPKGSLPRAVQQSHETAEARRSRSPPRPQPPQQAPAVPAPVAATPPTAPVQPKAPVAEPVSSKRRPKRTAAVADEGPQTAAVAPADAPVAPPAPKKHQPEATTTRRRSSEAATVVVDSDDDAPLVEVLKRNSKGRVEL